jgi:hypothetical protein
VLLTGSPYATTNGLMFFLGANTPPVCVGIVHGTIPDDTGGKIAAITPSMYILETIDKAMK